MCLLWTFFNVRMYLYAPTYFILSHFMLITKPQEAGFVISYYRRGNCSLRKKPVSLPKDIHLLRAEYDLKSTHSPVGGSWCWCSSLGSLSMWDKDKIGGRACPEEAILSTRGSARKATSSTRAYKKGRCNPNSWPLNPC